MAKLSYRKIVLVFLIGFTMVLGIYSYIDFHDYENVKLSLIQLKESTKPSTNPRDYCYEKTENAEIIANGKKLMKQAQEAWDQDPKYLPPLHRFHAIATAFFICLILTISFAFWRLFIHERPLQDT